MKNSEQANFSPFLAVLALTLLWFSGAAHGQQRFAPCKPVEVAVFTERIHVQCEVPVAGGFSFFAAPTSEPKFANRALSVILAAQLGGKVVSVLYDPKDTSGEKTMGCLLKDCRPLLGIVMEERLSPPLPPERCTLNPNDVGCPGFCKQNPTNAACVKPAKPRPKVCGKPPLPECEPQK